MITTAHSCTGRSVWDRKTAQDSPGQQLRNLLSEIQDTIDHTSGGQHRGDKLQKLIRCAEHLEGDAAQMLVDAIGVGELFASTYFEDFLTPPSAWDEFGWRVSLVASSGRY